MSGWGEAGGLLVWSAAEADETDGRGPVNVQGDEIREDVEHLALPGFYAVIASGDNLVLLRREDGGISIGSRTARPSGAAVGDRGIVTSAGLHLKLSGDVLTVSGCDATNGIQLGGTTKVVRHGDDCNRNAELIAWMAAVNAFCNAIAPGAIPVYVGPSIADAQASTTMVGAGP